MHRHDLQPLRARRTRARPHPECDPSCSARPRLFHREAPPLSGSGRQPGRHDATEGHEEVGGRGAHSPGAIASALLSAASNGCPQCVAARFRRRDDHQRGTGRSAPLAAIDAGSTSRKPQPGQRDRANTAARRFFADTSEHRSRDPAAGIRWLASGARIACAGLRLRVSIGRSRSCNALCGWRRRVCQLHLTAPAHLLLSGTRRRRAASRRIQCAPRRPAG